MKSLLEKLDRLAGNWVDDLDNQLQQPLLRAITGAVFSECVRQRV